MRFWFGGRAGESRAERRRRHREERKARVPRRQRGHGRGDASSVDPVTSRDPDQDVVTRYGDPFA